MSRLQNLRFLSFLGIRTSSVREFERWCAPKLEQDLCFSSLVDINLNMSSLADLHTRHLVDDLGDICSRLTLTGLVCDGGDGEGAGLLRDTSEICIW